MTTQIIQQFVADKKLSLNQLGKIASIAPSNISRILKGSTRLTDDTVARLVHAFPALLEYVKDEEEKRMLQLAELPIKYRKEIDKLADESYFKLLVPEMRSKFNSMAPHNYDFLPQHNLTMAVQNEVIKESMIVVQVVETDLGPRLLPGDLVRAVNIPEKDWPYTIGLVLLVYSRYAIIKRLSSNKLTPAGGELILEADGQTVSVPRDQIKQLMQVDLILRGTLSI